MSLKEVLNDNRTKHAFGKKANILKALEERKIDSYDVLFLDSGEIAWVDEEGNVVFSNSKTQLPFEFEGVTYEAGQSLDDIVKIFANAKTTSNYCYKDSYLQFPTVGTSNMIYIDVTENATYRWDNTNNKYYCIGRDYNNIEVIDGNID